MAEIINLYIDDSGTRHPDKKSCPLGSHQYDWFGLGGVMIKESDEQVARDRIFEFKALWPQIGSSPLHSVEIRHKQANFKWLNSISTDERERFMNDLAALLVDLPVLGIACVIDRPSYDRRYKEQYGRQRWALCKTAFSILIERASKHAINSDCKLRVMAEKCSKKEDRKLKSYYEDIKTSGQPFDTKNSARYTPLESNDFSDVLHEFRVKEKSSPLMQIADIYLWPMCIGGYDANNRSFTLLQDRSKLIDSIYPDLSDSMGVKYFCFDK